MRWTLPLLALLSACEPLEDTPRDPATTTPTGVTTTTPAPTSGFDCTSWLYLDVYDDGYIDYSTYLVLQPYPWTTRVERHQGSQYGSIIYTEDLTYNANGDITSLVVDPDGTMGQGAEWSQTISYDANGKRDLVIHDAYYDGVPDWSEKTTWDGDNWVRADIDYGVNGQVDDVWYASWDADDRQLTQELDLAFNGYIDFIETRVYNSAAPSLNHLLEQDADNDGLIDLTEDREYDDQKRLTRAALDQTNDGVVEQVREWAYEDIAFVDDALSIFEIQTYDNVTGDLVVVYRQEFAFDPTTELWDSMVEKTITPSGVESILSRTTWDWTCTE